MAAFGFSLSHALQRKMCAMKSTYAIIRISLLFFAALALHGLLQAQQSSDLQTPAGSTYYPNGMLKQQIEQTRSRRIDRSYYPSGVLQREQVWAMNGTVHVKERDVTLSPSGVTLREQRWAAGEPVVDLEYLISGLLISRKEYTGMGTTRELLVQSYFSSGVLATEERFAVTPRGTQHPIGMQKKFDVSGRSISEQLYDEHGKLLEDKIRNASGELVPVR